MITIRPATPDDQPMLGRMGAALMRMHHAADPRRFILTERPEAGYGRFLVSELDDPEALVQVAEVDGAVAGYLFAGIEGVSWKDLRGPCGFIHDVWVEEHARRQGVARRLMETGIAWIRSHGRSQIVLSSEFKNAPAQRLFASLGFRSTMVEMTLDVDAP